MATSSASSYDRIRSSLARAIRRRRADCAPKETARKLLSFESPTTRVIGLSYDGDRIIYRDRRNHDAFACRYDMDGPIRGSGVRIATSPSAGGLDRWIEKMGAGYWGWLHPRYRPPPATHSS